MNENQLILSVFPGIDLLGRAFERENFCIVRGPDLIFGGDVRSFHPPAGVFSGIIGGSPCQDFSRARREPPTGYGMEMIHQFERIVLEASPQWYLMENVSGVPDLQIPGYSHQRIDLNALECGSSQRRIRIFQFGSQENFALLVERSAPITTEPAPTQTALQPARKERRSWRDFCDLFDLPPDFDLPGWSLAAKYKAVGNGVPLKMGMRVAQGIKNLRYKLDEISLCACGCGRRVTGRAKSASPACRKRLQRKREQHENI